MKGMKGALCYVHPIDIEDQGKLLDRKKFKSKHVSPRHLLDDDNSDNSDNSKDDYSIHTVTKLIRYGAI